MRRGKKERRDHEAPPLRTSVGAHGPAEHRVEAVEANDTEKVAVVDGLGREIDIGNLALCHVVVRLQLQKRQVALGSTVADLERET